MTGRDKRAHAVCLCDVGELLSGTIDRGANRQTQLMDCLPVAMEARGETLPSRNPISSGFGDRPSNWPVSSRVGRYFRHAAAILVGLVLVSCPGGKPAPEKGASATGPVRGGTLIASLRSEPATFNRFAPTAAQAAGAAVARPTPAPPRAANT